MLMYFDVDPGEEFVFKQTIDDVIGTRTEITCRLKNSTGSEIKSKSCGGGLDVIELGDTAGAVVAGILHGSNALHRN